METLPAATATTSARATSRSEDPRWAMHIDVVAWLDPTEQSGHLVGHRVVDVQYRTNLHPYRRVRSSIHAKLHLGGLALTVTHLEPHEHLAPLPCQS